MNNVINAGDFRHKIIICLPSFTEDAEGFRKETLAPVCEVYASIKTVKGYTLLTNNTDFENATVNFTIRYKNVFQFNINRDMLILYNGKRYTIEYLNNVDLADVLLEIQAKEVTK